MVTTIKTKDVRDVKEKFGGEFRREFEDMAEKYIKINFGIREWNF